MLEATELVDLVRYNAERYESLTNNLSCNCDSSLSLPEPEFVAPLPVVAQPVVNCVSVSSTSESNIDKTSYIFSDMLGQGFGSLLSQYSQNYVFNQCLPGASYYKLVDNINLTRLHSNSTAILMYGDSLAVTKKDIIECVELMIGLNKKNNCKFIICALPYSQEFTSTQNRHIYDLNMLIYNITCRHSDAILYFDTNKFIRKFKLTKDTMYLPISCRRQIAKLLAYNIQAGYGTCAVPKIIVSNSTNITDDSPCSLNFQVGQRGGRIN